jgi:hypothetical protein
MRRTMLLLVLLALPFFSAAPAVPSAFAGGITTQDVPTALVPSGVDGFTLAAPKLFWYNGVDQCPPGLRAEGIAPASLTQKISRISAHGGPTRTLYSQAELCNQGKILSNMAADTDYLYWLAPTGLVRLSTNANPGDPYQLVNALIKPYGQVVDGGDKTFYLSPSGPNTEIGYVLKSNNQRVNLTTVGGTAGSLQYDGSYIYFILNGNLYRLNPGVDSGVFLASSVSSYYAEGSRFAGCILNPPHCFFTNSVFIGQGTTVRVYNNLTNTLGASPIYTSAAGGSIYNLVSDNGHLFVFERDVTPCGQLFCPTNDVLFRMGRGGQSPAGIYVVAESFSPTSGLTTDGTFLYWQENGAVQQLPNDAAALPSINMFVTGIEVTQGIQNLSNSVPLIQNRRTFARVYVQSAGASVAGVTAQLSSRLGVLQPVNPAGTTLTVRASPNRNDINQSFLFELPWSWTTSGQIQLTATLNPYKFPLEPNYTDDVLSTGTLTFNPSPSLSVQFFRLNYPLGGTTYRPRITDDVLKTYSWIMRAYPIGGAIGQNFKPTLWDVDGGTKLANWVNQSSSDCTKAKIGASDLALCASYYTNGWLKYYRDHGWVPNTTAFYYGMISDGSFNFPRGQAIYDKTSVGPSGTPCSPFSLGCGWDTDGSYADWYAGHEIGHSLGRAHPNAGSDNPATPNTTENCGHSRSDPGFPYGNTSTARAPIGPADNSMEGFDAGDPSFGIAKAVYPSATWNDVMSYCSNQWVSDYTYNGMYSYMIGHPSLAAAASASPALNGDFLAVAGTIDPATPSAGFGLVSRLASVATQPPITPGAYTLRLLNGQGGTLASYAFTPAATPESDLLSFDQVVNFAAGTRTIQIVTTSGGQVLASYAVSAHAPAISGVALQGAPNPVSGVVTLGWNANDQDGDALTFDIYYSRDNGATFQPAKMGATGNSTQLDTAALGGSGTAILRVVASDGVNTAEASSAPFVMGNKPPDPHILTPGNNTHIHYGQLVNFSGMAFDVQDGTVGAGGLVWLDAQGGTLGTGPLISLDALPVGSNVITLKATNSVGQSATTTVTVLVDDDLNLPGPTLTVGPAQVGWHIGAGDGVQTAQLSIGNSGGGALGWQASSDQPWLTLDAASGTVADGGATSTLTLTADPTGLAAGKTHLAHVTVTLPAGGGNPAETVVVPVSLSIGDVWTSVLKVGGRTLFVPLIKR